MFVRALGQEAGEVVHAHRQLPLVAQDVRVVVHERRLKRDGLLEYLTARGDLGRGLGHHDEVAAQR